MKLHDLIKGYQHTAKIIDYLIDFYDVKYTTSDNAPEKYDEMCQYYEATGEFLIFDGGDTDNYLGHEYTIKFRALHDFMHYSRCLKFTFKDEKILSDITAQTFYNVGLKLGLNIREALIVKAIMNAEIKGQIEYFEVNKSYVPDQTKFIEDYLKVS